QLALLHRLADAHGDTPHHPVGRRDDSCSIFIASRTIRGVPAPTCSSAPCLIATTRPANSAVTAISVDEAMTGSSRTRAAGRRQTLDNPLAARDYDAPGARVARRDAGPRPPRAAQAAVDADARVRALRRAGGYPQDGGLRSGQ